MIYKREDYLYQGEESERFPVKHIEALTDLATGSQKFVGQVTLGLQTPMGVQQIPISFEIEAENIEAAFAKFDECAGPKIDEARQGIEEEISRMRRDASTRIVRPDEMGMGGGGMPGLGKEQQGGSPIIDFKKPLR